MKIKMTSPKNVYGKRVPVGKVLTVGVDVPEWQAANFLKLSLAEKFVSPTTKKKASK